MTAREKGWNAYQSGQSADACPYWPGTEIHWLWYKGWREAKEQAELTKAIADNPATEEPQT
jgi:ribosome modulation factor